MLGEYVSNVPGATAANKTIKIEVGNSTQTIIIKDDKTGKEVYRGSVDSPLGGQSVTFDSDTLDVVRNVPSATANAFSGNTAVYDATKKFK